jgi:uncharacterized protein (TIGR03437 family)
MTLMNGMEWRDEMGRVRGVVIAAVMMMVVAQVGLGQAPSISGLSVTAGTTGTAVTISGANFGSSASTSAGTSTVGFNGVAAGVTSWSSGSIGVTAPAGATSGNVVVSVNGVASNGVRFTVVPNITGLLVNGVGSSVGPVGATLTLQGTGFGAAGFSTATLNGIVLAGNGVKPVSWSNTAIVAVIPNTASSGPVKVTVGGKTSNLVSFTIGAVITGVTPASGVAGSPVTVTGNGFGTAGGTVTFNGQAAVTTGWTDSSINSQVPSGATAGPVVVTVNGVASNGMGFTPVPVVSGLSPAWGVSGSSVVVQGSSFGAAQGTSTVSFNGVTAAVVSWSNTSIQVTAPGGALTGPVVVAVNGVQSAGSVFTYTPGITALVPSTALAQTPIKIEGSNFGATQGTSTVTFNGVAAAVTNWNNNSIAAMVPGNASAGPVVVTVNGVDSNGIPFSFPAPYSFQVAYAPNGDVLTAQDSVNGNWNYTYDDFNRLATATNTNPPQSFGYAYDRYGNRWQQNLTAGSGGQSLLTFNGSPAATINGNCYHAAGLNNQHDGSCHDAAGNLLSDGQHSYTYDGENRIIAVDAGQTATYVYDGEGLRIRKVSAAGTADNLYDLAGQMVAELSGSGAWTRSEVYAGGRHLATYRDGTPYFVEADWLGTERARALPSGALVETCISLPFGDGMKCNGSTDPTPNHFTGKPRDPESGLDYLGARYYSSGLGRFTSVDPIWVKGDRVLDPQRLNLYAYGRDNPLRFKDPTGMDVALGKCPGGSVDNCFNLLQHGLRKEDRSHVHLVEGDGKNGFKQKVFGVTVDIDYKSDSKDFTTLQTLANDHSAIGVIDVLGKGDSTVIRTVVSWNAKKGYTYGNTPFTMNGKSDPFQGYTFFEFRGKEETGIAYTPGKYSEVVLNNIGLTDVEVTSNMYHELTHLLLGDFGRSAPKAEHSDGYDYKHPKNEADRQTQAAGEEATANAKQP